MTGLEKPLILICALGAAGHMGPCKFLAKSLKKRGYDVTFTTASEYAPMVAELGVAFVPLQGLADFVFDPEAIDKRWPERRNLEGPAEMLFDMDNIFCEPIPSQFESVQRALKLMTEKDPGRPVIVLQDHSFCGVLPLLLGAEGIKPAGVIAIGHTAMMLSSQDTPPMGSGMLPDSSPEGRKRNIALHEESRNGVYRKIIENFYQKFDRLGARRPEYDTIDSMYVIPDRFIQLCTPSAEFPRSDLPKNIVFAGNFPRNPSVGVVARPSWWEEVTTNPSKKRIIFVSQGTIAVKYEELIIPTIQAFAEREDVLVIVALGIKNASLPPSVKTPSNARVEDFIPFDDILPYCDVLVTNGGYGAFRHGLINGVPMVIGGGTQEKPETAARCEWAGAGINMRTGKPSVQLLRDSVEKVLADQKYKNKVLEIKAEMEAVDAISIFEKHILELAQGKTA
ncbi:cc33c666-9d10-4d36-ab9e-5571a23a85b1 [Sclerotinia trifoliorum]|uniref:Cc33c666-9d10-4d36-ab9e-5571a23a85b1 n=1 Tax=Sclerotinia trifoliorum TaxID=28548 RepID=A0A8H2W394_9HELO|nr:cc33c666-9d10-4d36-ab9e-5571a23a85b1 [Sclerotinia trifoliorum]